MHFRTLFSSYLGDFCVEVHHPLLLFTCSFMFNAILLVKKKKKKGLRTAIKLTNAEECQTTSSFVCVLCVCVGGGGLVQEVFIGSALPSSQDLSSLEEEISRGCTLTD